MKKIRIMATALCLVAALAACGSESTTTKDSSSASASGTAEATSAATITIGNMAFGEPVTVAPGATITIKNNDSVEHSVTSETKGQFDTHVDGGKQKTMTVPTAPGEYAFYCVYHPNMKGTLIVK